MLDNVAGLLLAVGLLKVVFHFPESFALNHLIPGTALGVLIGDAIYTLMAFQLARRTGRLDVTAMPLGLDTPSTLGMVFFVLGPAYSAQVEAGASQTAAATHAWHVGIVCMVASGLFKLACSFGSDWIRRLVPRAGLLGSLSAIALVLISFLPLLEIFHQPLVGLVSLVVILGALVARVEFPGRIPGALAALLLGMAVYYSLRWLNLLPPSAEPQLEAVWMPTGWLEAFDFSWTAAAGDALRYFPIVIPFALATVVGGIDCTESAAATGDEYRTGPIVAVEAVATLFAGLAGGVIQTTPYIGHPAYKAMGGRAAYTLATALFVGSAGALGFFCYFYEFVPRATVFPILVFIGLEITAQSFHATPVRHYPAVALACMPAMASLVMIFVGDLLAQTGRTLDSLPPPLAANVQTMRMLSNGFILTSLLWASALSSLVDRRLMQAAVWFLVAACLTLFGVIHSPLEGSPLLLPWELIPDSLPGGTAPSALPQAAASQTPLILAIGYLAMAGVVALWSRWTDRSHDPAGTPPEPTRHETR
jgi:AGZA family xanthine/uracil permease-like MFS transporter